MGVGLDHKFDLHSILNPSCWKFQKGLEYRNAGERVNSVDDSSISCRHL